MTAAKPTKRVRRRTSDPDREPVCKVSGCQARVYTRGLCALHWCSRGDLADPVVPSSRA